MTTFTDVNFKRDLTLFFFETRSPSSRDPNPELLSQISHPLLVDLADRISSQISPSYGASVHVIISRLAFWDGVQRSGVAESRLFARDNRADYKRKS
jgi:hypothetical protein